jgi:IS1 family transposase
VPKPKGHAVVYILKREKQQAIVRLFVEGCSIRSIERATEVHRDSITRLLVRVGNHCRNLHDELVRNVEVRSLEMDELWCFVTKKQRNVLATDNPTWGDAYTHLGMDAHTKLIVGYLVGKRTPENTDIFVNDVAERISTESETQVNTDGWTPYPAAVRHAFAGRVDHAVIIKEFGKSTVDSDLRYSPPRFIRANRKTAWGSPRVDLASTSHAERLNLSVRTSLRRFTRLSIGFSRKLENLEAAVDLFVMWQNFVRPHRSLGGLTPAQQAGIANERWDIDRLIPDWPRRSN